MLKLPPREGYSDRGAVPVYKIVLAVVCIVLGLLSRTALSGRFSSVDTYQHEIEVLDSQKNAAATLSVASASASAAISFIPDDVCTPIANELAEISKGLAIVTGAILLEKYLLTIFGYAFFSWLIPICCVLLAAGLLLQKRAPFASQLMEGALKLLVMGFILWRAVPISVFVVDRIGETYDITINQAIDEAQAISEAVPTEDAAKEESSPAADSTNNEDKSLIDKAADMVNGAGDAVGTVVDNAIDLTTGKVNELVAWAKVVLTQITEGFAVLVVTSCVIPLLIPVIMAWMVKMFFQPSAGAAGVMPIPQLPGPKGPREHHEEPEEA